MSLTASSERLSLLCPEFQRKWTSVQALIVLTDTAAEAEEVLAGPMGARAIAGTADALCEQLQAYAALGFDEFIIPDFNLGRSLEQRLDAYGRIKADVVDQL